MNTPRPISEREAVRACKKIIIPQEARDGSGSASAFIGLKQERFMHALTLGIESADAFANIVVSGLSGTAGFDTISLRLAEILNQKEKKGAEENKKDIDSCVQKKMSALNDWVYVHNFENPHAPVALPFKKGMGRVFQKKLRTLLRKLKRHIPEKLGSYEIMVVRGSCEHEFESSLKKDREVLERAAAKRGFAILETIEEDEDGSRTLYMNFAPLRNAFKKSGSKKTTRKARVKTSKKTVRAEKKEDTFSALEIQMLSKEKQHEIRKHEGRLNKLLMEFLEKTRKVSRERMEQLKKIEEDAVAEVVDNIFDESSFDVRGEDVFARFIQGLREYAKEQYDAFLPKRENRQESIAALFSRDDSRSNPLLPFEGNVFMDHSKTEKTPIVAEGLFSVSDLVGNIEYVGMMGVAYTNHMMIHPGALARANKGFLVVNAEDVFSVPGLWMVLRKAMRTQANKFETLASLQGYGTQQLNPIPIPLNIRFVLFGSRGAIEQLAFYDPALYDLFTIRAEVAPFVRRTKEEEVAYGAWAQRITDEKKLPDLSPEALGKIVEYAGRIADHQERLSTDFSRLETLIKESGTVAEGENAPAISRAHVTRAIRNKFWRSDLVYEYMQEAIAENDHLISVSGPEVGEGNALTVVSRGDISFGLPSRVAAVVSVGKPGFVNIVRKVEMSEHSLNKADETVQAIFKKKFAQNMPLALEIIFTFEQLYGMIAGDSASIAEFVTSLSALSGVPIKQSVAFTGSLGIHEQIQPIGGVNQKIEGFFDTCRIKGAALSGEHGVIIPWQNQKHLMLRDDIVAAVKDGTFNVWPVRTLEECVYLLTGMPAGEIESDGTYPKGTVYGRALERAEEFGLKAKSFFSDSEK